MEKINIFTSFMKIFYNIFIYHTNNVVKITIVNYALPNYDPMSEVLIMAGEL